MQNHSNLDTEIAALQDQSYITTLNKMIMTTRVLFDMHSLNFLSLNKKQYSAMQSDIESCEKKFRNSLLTCLTLSGALALSIRRYFPHIYSKFSLFPYVLDLGLIATGLVIGARYASNETEIQVNRIFSNLITSRDPKVFSFIQEFQADFKISSRHVSKFVAANEQQMQKLSEIVEGQMQKRRESKAHHIY